MCSDSLRSFNTSVAFKSVQTEKRQVLSPAVFCNRPIDLLKNGEPWRARTSDLLIKSAFKDTPAGYGSYDLLTCSRQRVYLLLVAKISLPVVLSQVCLKWNPLPFYSLSETVIANRISASAG